MSRAWMKLYIADYLADTGHLSTLEHGAYLLLIMHYWRAGGLPRDDVRLARIAKLELKEWRAIADAIALLFLPEWRHKRIDAELSTAVEKSEKAKISAEKSWMNRKIGKKAAIASANALRSHLPTHSKRTSDRNAKASANDMLSESDLNPPYPLVDGSVDNRPQPASSDPVAKTESAAAPLEAEVAFEKFWAVAKTTLGGSKDHSWEEFDKLSQRDKAKSLNALPAFFSLQELRQTHEDTSKYLSERLFDLEPPRQQFETTG